MNIIDRLNLLRHKVFLHIPDEPLVCPTCGKKFSRWDWKVSGLSRDTKSASYVLNEEEDMYILPCPECAPALATKREAEWAAYRASHE